MTKRILDLFCGGGGAGFGYKLAGFSVVGVDLRKRACGYPAGQFIRGNALDILADRSWILSNFDAIHASPPCQLFSRTQHLRDAQGKSSSKLNLVPEVRAILDDTGLPYVLENVEGSPLRQDLLLCGSMFPELGVQDDTGWRWLKRHRIFEATFPVSPPVPCNHKIGVRPLGIYGSKGDNIPSGGQTARTTDEARTLMGTPWMSWAALVEAIPPAYTRWIGSQLLEVLQ